MTAVLRRLTPLLDRLLAPFLWLARRESGLFETVSGVTTLLWGVLVLQKFPVGDPPASIGVYDALNAQFLAAVFAVLLGLGQLFAFDMIDRSGNRQRAHWIGALGGLMFWTIVSISTVFWRDPGPLTPLTANAWGMAVGQVALALRVARGYGVRAVNYD